MVVAAELRLIRCKPFDLKMFLFFLNIRTEKNAGTQLTDWWLNIHHFSQLICSFSKLRLKPLENLAFNFIPICQTWRGWFPAHFPHTADHQLQSRHTERWKVKSLNAAVSTGGDPALRPLSGGALRLTPASHQVLSAAYGAH